MASASARESNRGSSEGNASRNRILDVAEQVFAERGFAATSMRHVAQEAGINVATLYYHCGSKEQLFVSIYARVVERMADWVAETFEAGSDFESSVALLVDRVVAYLAEHPSIPRLLVRSDLGELPAADDDKREVYRPLYEMVAQTMKTQAERGEIRAVDPRTFVVGATGVITYLSMSLRRGQDASTRSQVDPEQLQAAQRHARLFILGALGLEPDAS